MTTDDVCDAYDAYGAYDEAYLEQTRRRVEREQGGIHTYYDRSVVDEEQDPHPLWRARLRRHAAARAQGRFVPWEVRASVDAQGLHPRRRSEISDSVMLMSQGTSRPLEWQGRALFKSVFDFTLIPMLLAELQPAAVLEIGSGNGASALWMADLAELFGFPCRITSLDVEPVAAAHPEVRFVRGDARDLAGALPADALAHGPRLVVEDAHVAVREVLEYVHGLLEPGDYLMVEDSADKAPELAAFAAAHPGAYAVDTRYTDYFGRNATSCVDSVWRRMADSDRTTWSSTGR
ncbi:cephalosporin hydroxylase [Kitasatospora sp. MAA4]|uniref:CmcI family methyltransferase n=1 Tax=Kitasatospora sp. MAA4 TaxID=3035093 RepID=UPI0024755E4B|nr:CmcI family methyltransferase [Kitasatospora sp. MAA4]MDH6131285.1 cephalosporin hydroxylase [Kitasatospora sp. MAA4]